MLSLPASVKVYVASEPVDGRKGFNGLLAIVRSQWRRDVFTGHLFVFFSRRRKRATLCILSVNARKAERLICLIIREVSRAAFLNFS